MNEYVNIYTHIHTHIYIYTHTYTNLYSKPFEDQELQEASVRQHLATLGLKAPATAEAVKRAFRPFAFDGF